MEVEGPVGSNVTFDQTKKQNCCHPVASQPINEGGQSPGAPRSKGPPSATCKKLCHEIITDTLLTSDTLTISGKCYDISNTNVQPKSKILLVLSI